MNITFEIAKEIETERKIPLSIVYEDGDLIVVNRQVWWYVPPGIVFWYLGQLLYHCRDALSGLVAKNARHRAH